MIWLIFKKSEQKEWKTKSLLEKQLNKKIKRIYSNFKCFRISIVNNNVEKKSKEIVQTNGKMIMEVFLVYQVIEMDKIR